MSRVGCPAPDALVGTLVMNDRTATRAHVHDRALHRKLLGL